MSTIETGDEYWFVFQNDRLLLTKEERLLTKHSLAKYHLPFLRQLNLGEFNSTHCYCAEIDSTFIIPDDLQLFSLRKSLEILSQDWYPATVKAFSVINWDRNHLFCGHCGNVTAHSTGTFMRVCPHCGLILYPRISPSIIVLIRKEDEVLMARSPHFRPGSYGLISGFVEVGENIEDTIYREVKEEVGIEIKNLHYFGSQAWPFPDSLMIAFIADYASGEIKIDNKEIEEAGWYRYDNLPGGPSTNMSIARKLIDYFIAEQTKNGK